MASSPANLQSRRATVCLECGDKGDTALLIYCANCHNSAVHHYCMDNVSREADNIDWWCWDCSPKDSQGKPLRKSKRISSKKQKVLKARSYWKERLKQNKKLARTSNGISETGRLTIDGPLPTTNLETELLHERQRNQVISEEKTSITETPCHFEKHSESTKKVDKPTIARESPLPFQEENNMSLCDENQKIKKARKKRRILLLNDNSTDSQDEGKTIDLQESTLVANDHCITSDTLCDQPALEADDSPSAEPVFDPIWRGWFNSKEESETCFEILAHLSNKADSRASHAASAFPPILDIQVLNKDAAWPRIFRVSPPTAASIALYFFPASERDERVFDSLLDEVIEKDRALKAVIDNLELLMFSSRELPLRHWRYNGKYFLWGVFRRKKSSLSKESMTSTQQNSSTEYFGLSQTTTISKNKDMVHHGSADHFTPPSQPNQSPLSMASSQASNVFSSKHNTPDPLSSPSFELNRLGKTV